MLILDDATSAVDATKEHEIRNALAQVMAGRTTLVIAHRPATIALADRVAVVDEGRVVEQGTHAELVARSARYRGLLALADGGGGVKATIGPILRPYRRLIVWAGLAMIGGTAVSLAAPLFVKVAIDRGVAHHDVP